MDRKKSDYKYCFLQTPDGIVCKDNALRTFVTFGTPRWTCKFWKSGGFAKRYANTRGFSDYTIMHVYEGDAVHCNGTVFRKRNR